MSGASYRIRAMEDDEADAAAALVRRVFDEFNRAQYPKDRPIEEPSAEKARELAAQGVVLLAIAADDSIVGVLALDGEDHLEWLFVDPAHHRRGVATTLWETLLLWRPGAESFTVNASDYAIGWYETLGWTHDPGHKSRTTGAPIKRMIWRRG